MAQKKLLISVSCGMESSKLQRKVVTALASVCEKVKLVAPSTLVASMSARDYDLFSCLLEHLAISDVDLSYMDGKSIKEAKKFKLKGLYSFADFIGLDNPVVLFAHGKGIEGYLFVAQKELVND